MVIKKQTSQWYSDPSRCMRLYLIAKQGGQSSESINLSVAGASSVSRRLNQEQKQLGWEGGSRSRKKIDKK